MAQPQAPAVVYAASDPGAFQAGPQAAPGEPQRAWLAPATPPPVANADPGPSPWRALAVLLVVAAIGGGALYVQRAKGGGAIGGLLGNKGQGGLRVVDTVRVGPRAQLVVAEFGGRRFLIGVNDTSIRRVAYLGRSAAAAQIARVAAQEDAPIDVPAPGGFTEAMRRALASSASQPVAPVAPSQPHHPVATTPSVPSVNAADLLASETRDVVDLGAGARMSRVLATRDTTNSPRPSDVYTRTPGPSNVEEQVAGLTRRRIPRRG
jgi:flagellar biogenesis protein FliO